MCVIAELNLESVGPHAGDMLLHEFFTFLVRDRVVILQETVVSSGFSLWASTASIPRYLNTSRRDESNKHTA